MDSDLNGASPQFTLTCNSTGGPATTVTWTRDSEMLTGSTVLNDATTAQYTHTLTVTGRLGGLYTCTVANARPSEDSATYTVQGKCTCYMCRVSHQSSDTINSRTLLCTNEATNPTSVCNQRKVTRVYTDYLLSMLQSIPQKSQTHWTRESVAIRRQ